MSQKQFDLSPAASVLSDAASAESTARDKWSRAGKALAKMGLVSEMLVKSTDKHPNALWNQSVYTQVRGFIIQGISASKKPVTLSTTVPGSVSAESPKGSNKWSVAMLLDLTTDQLREIDDDVLKSLRREYMQLVDGTMMSRVKTHIDKANGIVKTKGSKGSASTDTPTESVDPIVWIQDLINKATTVVDVADVDRFQNAGLEMIALLRKHRK
jgi:hypothetical protein